MLLIRCLCLDLLTADASVAVISWPIAHCSRSSNSYENDALTASETLLLVFESYSCEL
jgi:hypothetical protein